MPGYGLVKESHAYDIATMVCNVMGHGKNNAAVDMLIETAVAETYLGQYKDPTEYLAGTGLTQVDEGTFDWSKEKFSGNSKSKKLLRHKIKAEFDVDITLVSYNELAFSPLLAFIWCRLRYMTVTAQIPATREKRAFYWKDHYNSHDENAKGSAEKYLSRCEIVLG